MSNNEKVKEEIRKEINEEILEEATIPEIDKDDYINKLNDDLEGQRKKADEYFEHLKRNMAEFDNFKKRMTKEKDNLYVSVTSDIIEDLLPIIDNIEKAIETECSDQKYKDGIIMIYNQIKESLAKQGLEIVPDVGTTFDPNLQEAVMHEENDQYGEKEIIEVFRKGYRIGEKVIRHSMVKVAN